MTKMKEKYNMNKTAGAFLKIPTNTHTHTKVISQDEQGIAVRKKKSMEGLNRKLDIEINSEYRSEEITQKAVQQK